MYCGKRCRQAAYRARLTAERTAEYARYLRAELHQLRGDLAEASDDSVSVLTFVPPVDAAGVPGWPMDDADSYSNRAQRLHRRRADLTAAYRRTMAEHAAALAVFRPAEASAPVDDESGAGFVASRAAARDAT